MPERRRFSSPVLAAIHGVRILKAVEDAYADKDRTPPSLKYVRGFRLLRRRRTTTELLPV